MVSFIVRGLGGESALCVEHMFYTIIRQASKYGAKTGSGTMMAFFHGSKWVVAYHHITRLYIKPAGKDFKTQVTIYCIDGHLQEYQGQEAENFLAGFKKWERQQKQIAFLRPAPKGPETVTATTPTTAGGQVE